MVSLVLVAAAVAAGLAVGLVRGGSVRHARTVAGLVPGLVPGWVPAALLGAGLLGGGPAQAALALLPAQQHQAAGRLLLVAGVLAAAALLAGALRFPAVRRAAVVALLGGGLNAAAMLPNGAMPVSAEAARRLGVTVTIPVAASAAVDADGPMPPGRHVVADRSTPLSWLGDVLPVRLGPVRGLLSAGDVVLLVAAGLAVHDLMLRRTPKPPPGGSRTPERR